MIRNRKKITLATLIVFLLAVLVFLSQDMSLIKNKNIHSQESVNKLPQNLDANGTSDVSINNVSSSNCTDYINWYYPASTVAMQDDQVAILQSDDLPLSVSNWYKDKISSQYSSHAFTTNTINDTLESNLSARDDISSVNVTVLGINDNNQSRIVLSLKCG